MIKYLFSDLDGTLLNLQGQVSEVTQAVIRHQRLPLTLVSARAPMEMATIVAKLQLHGPQIAFNGGLIYETVGKDIRLIRHFPLDKQKAIVLLQLIQAEFPDISLSCYTQNDWLTAKIDRGILFESQLTGQTVQLTNYEQLGQQSACQIYKIMMMTRHQALMQQVIEQLKRLRDPDLSIKLSGTAYLEITSAQAQKSTGIRYIQQLKHLEFAEMAAFGDGENDLPMLRSVGMPIVMGNALPQIKAAGQFVTKSNQEDGLAYAIEHYLGGKGHD